jgi:hypothetical protein
MIFEGIFATGGQMDEQNAGMVKTIASQIRNAIGDDFKWEWDSRLMGALTQFEKSNEPQIQRALSSILAYEWHVTNVTDAPESVLIATDFMGGLRSGQTVMTIRPEFDPLVLAAFWPWGNGVTVSLRIVLFSLNRSPGQMDGLMSTFRNAFEL